MKKTESDIKNEDSPVDERDFLFVTTAGLAIAVELLQQYLL